MGAGSGTGAGPSPAASKRMDEAKGKVEEEETRPGIDSKRGVCVRVQRKGSEASVVVDVLGHQGDVAAVGQRCDYGRGDYEARL